MKVRNTWLFLTAFLAMGSAAQARQDAQGSAGNTVIKTETRLVVVDAVVKDKKDNYVKDLAKKDFKVWEDNKEQQIKVFTYEADPNSPTANQKRYLVLFFDNASMALADQPRAREAAQKFIDGNAGPNHLMAVVDFSGSLRVAQNFTQDTERLKEVVKNIKMSNVSTASDAGSVGLSRAAGQFGIRTVLLALQSLAKNMEDVPGRKTLVMLTAGFRLNPELMSEMTAAIDACNRSNIAVYPIDVRGLVTNPGMDVTRPGGGGGRRGGGLNQPLGFLRSLPGALGSGFQTVSYASSFAPDQRGGAGAGAGSSGAGAGAGSSGGGAGAGAGGGSGGGRGSAGSGVGGGSGAGGGAAGGRGGTGTGMGNPGAGSGRGSSVGNGGPGGVGGGGRGFGGGGPVSPNINTGYRGGRAIVPEFPPMASDNQQALYMLADGTGGFVILNTNDLLGGLQKIGAEQDQHYIIGYSPVESAEGSCHTLKVKVDRGGTTVRARSGYCNVKQVDLLSGTPTEKTLEARLSGSEAGALAAPMQVSYFYTAPGVARVDVAMDLPAEKLPFEKVKGKLHSDVNIMGIAYKPDGSVGARFSDTLKLEVADKKELEAYIKKPVHYENQFDIAPGQYTFKLAFNAGPSQFGKLESPIAIDPYDGKQFSMSGIALTSNISKTSESSGLDAELLQGLTPMIFKDMQIKPNGRNVFKKTDQAGFYVELYEPLILGSDPVKVGVQVKVFAKTGEQKMDSGVTEMTGAIRPGNAVVPLALKVPVADLAPGEYRLELTGLDSAGKSVKRSVDFNVTE